MNRQQRPVVSGLTHVLAFAITAAVFLILNWRFYAAAIGYDEEFFVWGGWCITKGLVPYRDFIDLAPPMVFITHALAVALFGLQNQGFRILFAALPLVSALVLQASLVARGIERFLAMAVVLAIVFLFLGPWQTTALSDPESIGLTYFMLGLALLLREGRHVKATTVAGGFFLLSCVMCRERLLPVVIATWWGSSSCGASRSRPGPAAGCTRRTARSARRPSRSCSASTCCWRARWVRTSRGRWGTRRRS